MEKSRQPILDDLLFRHACKEFRQEQKIPEEDFFVILEAARLAPSSLGFEPWKLVVLQDMQLRERIRPHVWGAQKQLPTASHFVLLLARRMEEMMPGSAYIRDILRDVQKLEADKTEAKLQRYENFLKNDFKMYGDARVMFEWACRQTYIALAGMMNAAVRMKIDFCPIEGFDRDKVEEILEEEGVLHSEAFGLCCMAAFGYRKNPQGQKTRRESEDVIVWR